MNINVNYSETAWLKRLALSIQRAKSAVRNPFSLPILTPALTFGLILLALTTGWLVLRNVGNKNEVAGDSTPQNQNHEEKSVPLPQQQENKEFVANTATNKDSKDSNVLWPKQPEMEIAPKNKAVLPPSQQTANNASDIRKDEIDENGVLRLPMRESNQRHSDPSHYQGQFWESKGHRSG